MKSKLKNIGRKVLWGFAILFVLLVLIEMFGPDPAPSAPDAPSAVNTNSKPAHSTEPAYSITASDQWEKESTFTVKVDSVLSEKDVLAIADKIKADSVTGDKRVTVWFYTDIDFSGASQTVRYAKNSPVPDYSVTAVSNAQTRDAKLLKIDSLADCEIIAADLIPNSSAKEIIYKLKNGKYAQTILFSKGGYTPFAYLEPDPGNGPDVFNFKFVSGPDEGMLIKIDKYQKYIEYRETGGNVVFRRDLID